MELHISCTIPSIWGTVRKIVWKFGPHRIYDQWFNSLLPIDAIWHHRSGSTLILAMACCLMAWSHYLNQCWLTINEALWHFAEGSFAENVPDIIHYRMFQKLHIQKYCYMSQGPKSYGGAEFRVQSMVLSDTLSATTCVRCLCLPGNISWVDARKT